MLTDVVVVVVVVSVGVVCTRVVPNGDTCTSGENVSIVVTGTGGVIGFVVETTKGGGDCNSGTRGGGEEYEELLTAVCECEEDERGLRVE